MMLAMMTVESYEPGTEEARYTLTGLERRKSDFQPMIFVAKLHICTVENEIAWQVRGGDLGARG
jgi:hypothetical protein